MVVNANLGIIIVLSIMVPLGIIFVFVGTLLAVMQKSKKDRCSCEVDAVVTKKFLTRGCEMQFVHNSETIKVKTHVDNRPSRYRVGDSVRIRYNPNNFSDKIIVGYTDFVSKFVSIGFITFGAFCFLMLGLAIWLIKKIG